MLRSIWRHAMKKGGSWIMEQKSAWKKYDESGRCRIEEFCDRYKEFLTVSKTERECVDTFTLEAREHGYMDL